MKKYLILLSACLIWLLPVFSATAMGASNLDYVYDPGQLKPVDSALKVHAGQPAPDFTLKSISGKSITMGQFKGVNNVVLSFVPAAWTPVCSDQWPGYNIARKIFEEHDAVLLGISVDNIPTLYAWTRQMGDLWFEVLSDFWPHGKLADTYGLLRTDGTAERALVFIDKKGIVRKVEVSDINVRPPLELIVSTLQKMQPRE